MATRREGTEDTFNELVALLRRNEGDEKHAADVEMDTPHTFYEPWGEPGSWALG
ncbi:hypothetical protein PHYSODRAFT_334118 [Phytophthora sojae]|uniref:Uncharacterized protein n=1 Tax=Phytophthora sojae (strain P6497) TaxID=1094619 RepID=G4ZKH3_PHYSP|nr:hypothetical protein PHYSODRAFT_334118 [Phytophthora sojae]EGZ15915.1 hypothetical protein PHYSODRAFT_334118 [Phytophthora sojae]|eukprot:XP_009529664.1 hypothetical protein PHYSODRAFT_334118 [Phytophthora sojae]